ncbi:hypothetical protein PG996_014450 [Apiospora saccharicola]|uniref:Uncharacterized protein n=1 Tax=Apiospora saccharicola TaxID=335842 RepID=A0ABR1TKD3_9PEZI
MTTVPVIITETSTCTTTTPPPVITHNSCEQTCSMSAGTVNLFFWPTDNDFIYPSTHVDTDLGYTFTRPSVYMLIPTIYGTNTIDGATVAPSATSAIWAFDLSEVSTIEGGTATKQLSLSDLGTDCPQTAAASEIATMTNSRCDPILAAPDKIRAWASPCAACDRFGLFDPPYAIPTITGGLVPTTIAQLPPPPPAPTTEAPKPAPTTQAPAPTTEAPAPKPTTEVPAPPAPQPTTEAPAPPAPQPTTEAPAPPPPTTEAPAPTTATAAPTSAEESAQPTTDAGVPAPSATSATSAAEGYPTTDASAGQSATTSSTAAGETDGASTSASATTPVASTSATDGVTSPTPVASAAAAQMKSGVAGMVAAGLFVLMA